MKKITGKQLDVMHALWESHKAMTASEIVQDNAELNINTVQASLKQLLKKEYIRVADIVYSGTVLCRSYAPLISKEQYVGEFFSKGEMLKTAAHLIEGVNDVQELEELKQLINERQKALEEKE